MEKELAALRSSESERLESTADKVARAASDWARIEAASQKHIAAVRDGPGRARRAGSRS